MKHKTSKTATQRSIPKRVRDAADRLAEINGITRKEVMRRFDMLFRGEPLPAGLHLFIPAKG